MRDDTDLINTTTIRGLVPQVLTVPANHDILSINIKIFLHCRTSVEVKAGDPRLWPAKLPLPFCLKFSKREGGTKEIIAIWIAKVKIDGYEAGAKQVEVKGSACLTGAIDSGDWTGSTALFPRSGRVRVLNFGGELV